MKNHLTILMLTIALVPACFATSCATEAVCSTACTDACYNRSETVAYNYFGAGSTGISQACDCQCYNETTGDSPTVQVNCD